MCKKRRCQFGKEQDSHETRTDGKGTANQQYVQKIRHEDSY
jgi:hypothetical protein